MNESFRSPSMLLVTPSPKDSSHSMKIYGNQVANVIQNYFQSSVYEWPNAECYLSPFSSRWYKYIYSPKYLERNHQPAIQHITDQSFAHLYNKNAGKNILTVHDINPIVCFRNKIGSNRIRPPIFFYYVAKYFKKFDHIITPTHTTKNYLIDILSLSAGRITVVSNAVDEDKYLGLEGKIDGMNILLIGSTLYKNCIASFEAIVNFAVKSDSAITIHWVVSENPDSQMVTYFQNRNCKVVLKIYTNLERHELIQLYRSSCVLLFPSLIEGFGYPIIEALRNRLPVITSDQGAMEEIAGTHCILVNPMSVNDIERGLTKFFNSNVEIALDEIERGYEYSMKFNNENFKRDILAVYDKVGVIGE
jgi:glycosyltransferase involved in cell wall biosynthesis